MNSGQQSGTRFLDALDEQTRLTLGKISRRASYPLGEIIVQEGRPGQEVYVLLSGRCDVVIHGETVSRLYPGDLFGEIGSLAVGGRTATVQASEACEVLEITGDALWRVLRQSPSALNVFLQAVARRIRRISERETKARQEHLDLQAVQREMLPRPDVVANSSRFSLEVRWQPLTYASGDYCDVVELGPERFLVAMGDVAGHGARASVTWAMVRGKLRDLAGQGVSPREILAGLDAHLTAHGPTSIHMTLIVLLMNGKTMTARFSSAGHLEPLVWRDGRVESLSVESGPFIGYGFGRELGYHEQETAIRSGDRILLLTDGLTEARCGPEHGQNMLGEEGLQDVFLDVCKDRSRQILDPLFAAVDGFRRGLAAQDDATAMLIHVK